MIIDDIIRREGGYVDRSSDRGGPTNMGITMATLAAWRRGQVTIQDIKSLTMEEASAIYEAKYVVPWSFIDDATLREVLVDWGVNSGLSVPTRVLQNFLSEQGVVVASDGVLGDRTRNAWKSLVVARPDHAATAARRIAKARVLFVTKLAIDEQAKGFLKAHPSTQLHNLIGWVTRSLEFL